MRRKKREKEGERKKRRCKKKGKRERKEKGKSWREDVIPKNLERIEVQKNTLQRLQI